MVRIKNLYFPGVNSLAQCLLVALHWPCRPCVTVEDVFAGGHYELALNMSELLLANISVALCV